jgi:hypothetical protein
MNTDQENVKDQENQENQDTGNMNTVNRQPTNGKGF